ncbi:MAG: hypothetical protein ABGZ24_28100, partial [Fuerstiella sp.]
MFLPNDISIALTISIVIGCPSVVLCADFHHDVKPLLGKYCIKCHSGDDANGDVDFSAIDKS